MDRPNFSRPPVSLEACLRRIGENLTGRQSIDSLTETAAFVGPALQHSCLVTYQVFKHDFDTKDDHISFRADAAFAQQCLDTFQRSESGD